MPKPEKNVKRSLKKSRDCPREPSGQPFLTGEGAPHARQTDPDSPPASTR